MMNMYANIIDKMNIHMNMIWYIGYSYKYIMIKKMNKILYNGYAHEYSIMNMNIT